nr:phage major capsid protein [Actinomycetota bacterium]
MERIWLRSGKRAEGHDAQIRHGFRGRDPRRKHGGSRNRPNHRPGDWPGRHHRGPQRRVQAVDLSNLDEAIAAELGNAFASQLDLQVISGSGTAGQLLGLLNVAGITSVTHTSATPTALENLARIGQVAAATGSAFGAPVDAILLHPRRFAYITTKATGGAPELAGGADTGRGTTDQPRRRHQRGHRDRARARGVAFVCSAADLQGAGGPAQRQL